MNLRPTVLTARSLAFLFVAMLVSPAGATIINVSASMDCAQANAGAGTCAAGGTGTGTALLTYNDTSGDLSWNVTWSGLSGTTTVAHFHGPALPNQNAGVQVDFLSLGGGLNPSMGTTAITSAQGTDLLAGLWYVNVHSTAFPGGEIRGQITQTAVSEPVTLALMCFGLAGISYQRCKQIKAA